jgi:hypothetical protein
MFSVPLWVIMQPNGKEKTIEKWFDQSGAKIQPWPAATFKDTVMKYANKGWKHIFPKNPGEQYVLPSQFVMMAIADHVRETLGPTSIVSFNFPVHRLDRRIRTDVDFVRIFDEVFETQSDIVIAQAFQIAEYCYREGAQNTHVWFTQAPCQKNILTRISERVITIGEDEKSDINVKEVKAAKIPDFLEEQFETLVNALKKK